jgi:iron complex transport system substrate-binding protein
VRIVSLLPAATEIVCALGLRESLVGRSHECDFPADVEALPALTRARLDTSLPSETLDAEVRRIVHAGLPIYELDDAQLSALAPDVVVTQEACEVCAISYDQVVASTTRSAPTATIVSLKPSYLSDVFEDIRTVAAACGVRARGDALVAELRERVARATRQRDEAWPRVAVIEWLSPPMLAGHWVPETIVAARGAPVGPEPGEMSPYTTWDAVKALALDAVIVAPCGFDLPRTIDEATPLARTLNGVAPRVLLLDGNAYLNRPGPRLVDAIETIAAWLRGEPVVEGRGIELQSAPSRLRA